MSDSPKAKPPLQERTGLLVAGGLVVIGSTMFLAWAGWRMADTDDSDVAQWLMAVAAALTLVAAVAAATFAAGVYRVESDREERALELEERAHAQTFAAWTVTPGVGRGGIVASSDGVRRVQHMLNAVKVLFRNGSDMPIHDVGYEVRLESNDPEIDGRLIARARGNHLDSVPPRDTVEVLMPETSWLTLVGEEFDGRTPKPVVKSRVAIQFKDSRGKYWRRHADGDLDKGTGELHF